MIRALNVPFPKLWDSSRTYLDTGICDDLGCYSPSLRGSITRILYCGGRKRWFLGVKNSDTAPVVMADDVSLLPEALELLKSLHALMS